MAARTKPKNLAVLRLVYVDFWSALKMSFLISLVLAGITIVLTLLTWSVLEGFGLIAYLNGFLEDLAGEQGASLLATLNFSSIMTFTLVVSLLEVAVVSGLGAIFAALFNLATTVSGGWRVTFGSD